MDKYKIPQMCKINHNPLKEGSIVRNNGFGSRLMKVISINVITGELILESYGSTNYGKFKPSVRPRHKRAYLSKHNSYVCFTNGSYTCWYYTHVTTLWNK